MELLKIIEIEKIYESIKPEIEGLNRFVYDHPELGLEEYESAKAHAHLLESHGFSVEMPYLGMATSFRAEFDTKRGGRNIAFLSEYDALPGIGHGCGHNILGASTTGAGILLSKLIPKGKVTVIGTPAEETLGGKVILANGGAFADVHGVYCTHPDNEWYSSGHSLAMESVEFRFHGKTAHASTQPEEGINALEGVLLLFHNINAIRQTFTSLQRVTGIIKDGGEAANVIPDFACARFHIRAASRKDLAALSARIRQCAAAAAMAIGCRLDTVHYEETFLDLRTNRAMSRLFDETIGELGVEMVPFTGNPGSLDMGNVSYQVPSANPSFKISNGHHHSLHTAEFRDLTITPTALENMGKTVITMAKCAWEIMADDGLYGEIYEEFINNVVNAPN